MKSPHEEAGLVAVDPLTATHTLSEFTAQRRDGQVSFAKARHGRESALRSAQVPADVGDHRHPRSVQFVLFMYKRPQAMSTQTLAAPYQAQYAGHSNAVEYSLQGF
jgi:hypothetical protein